MVLVLLESLAGSGHKYAALRPRLSEKLETYKFDPMGKTTIYVCMQN